MWGKEMHDIELKLNILKKIYEIYDRFMEEQKIACEKYCSDCCTCNVTMTTLEGYMIVDSMSTDEKEKTFGLINSGSLAEKRFQPELTTNMIADLCADGKEIPDDEPEQTSVQCPFLEEDHCPVYAARPFGCRCFISEEKCGQNNFASVSPLIITVNHLFLQYIEHIDLNGLTGNLSDIMIFLEFDDARREYAETGAKSTKKLIQNRELKTLMVPPEHREKVQPILNRLNAI
jgi:hypothetical protein